MVHRMCLVSNDVCGREGGGELWTRIFLLECDCVIIV